jgi:hypothetical protein
MPQLHYLDDAPVDDKDRRLAAAFMQVRRARQSCTGNTSSIQASLHASMQGSRRCTSAIRCFVIGMQCSVCFGRCTAVMLYTCLLCAAWLLPCSPATCAAAAARVGLLQRLLSARLYAARQQQQHSSSAITLMPWLQQHGQRHRCRMTP